ncbi:MAG: ribosomal protein S18-alanine N-acetyltransferase [Candidatus Hydrothermarchaeota archaeon]|nr:ribosomal protein S18-alanine N-acetyltransferase [Candidatus Hydrothermarchaeota archaeon]
MIIIRKFRPSDLGRVHEIECRSFKDPYHTLFLLNLYETYPDTFFVAEENGAVVGYVISRMVNRSGHVLAIAVDPRHRNRGLGRALMNAVTERLREFGMKDIYLEVRISNTAAINFYKKLGFEVRGIVRSYYSDGEDAVILKKIFTACVSKAQ